MTEYELADLISSYAVQGGTFFTLWLTMLSAYAIVSYSVGKDLSFFQVSWLNTLYLYATVLAVYAFHGSFRTQLFYVNLVKEMNPQSPHIMGELTLVFLTTMAGAGTLTTLLFMWFVRHTKVQ